MKRHVIFCLLLCASTLVVAATDEDGYNEYTIRPSDIPPDAPKFEDFPAKIFSGQNALPDLRSNATARTFRSRLAQWAKEKPNFAGHYILATWGCGTDCTHIALIDARTGRIFHPPGATTNVAVNVHDALLEESDLWHATGAVKFRPDSRLLILVGMPEESVTNRGISYYVWANDRLKRIRFVHKAWYPSTQ